jgi:tetratricopeptide (TPR) repeat protein
MARFRISLAAFALAGMMQAQEPAPSPAPTAGGGGGGTQQPTMPSGGQGTQQPGNQGRNPFPGQNQDPNQQQRMPEMQRSVFLSGKVMLDDGTPPPEPVTIERVCNGNPRPEGYTDSKGRFSFELGRNTAMMADASTNMGNDGFGGGMPGQPQRGGFGNSGFGGVSNIEQQLMGCELRASLAGFRSDVVNLAGRRVMDNPDVGTIVLHRLANVEGFTFSATSGLAPKDAKKSFEKSRELLRKKKLPEAQKELEKATSLYAKYASAWYELGRVYEAQKQIEPARKAFEASIEADPKFVSPYLNLSGIFANEGNWEKTAELTAKAVKLNPFEYPTMYFYNAVANLNLQKLDEAEKSAREARKLDGKNRIPKIDHVLGIVLAQKRDLPGAKDSLSAYLKASPNAGDADQVKKQLEQIDKLIAEGQ